MLCLCLIDNISSKVVPLEKAVVLYGANILSLLPVVLFVLPINVHVCLFSLLCLLVKFIVCVWHVQCNKPAWLIDISVSSKRSYDLLPIHERCVLSVWVYVGGRVCCIVVYRRMLVWQDWHITNGCVLRHASRSLCSVTIMLHCYDNTNAVPAVAASACRSVLPSSITSSWYSLMFRYATVDIFYGLSTVSHGNRCS